MAIPEFVIDIIFPSASLLQLYTVIRSSNLASVSVPTWLLFALANVAAYIYLGKFWAPQAIAYLIAASIQVGIVVVALKKQKHVIKNTE